MTMIKRVERDDGPRFQVYAYKNGKKVYVSSHLSRPLAVEAEEDHRVTQRKIDRGELAAEHDSKVTISGGIEQWLAALKLAGSRSHVAYTECSDGLILPRLGPVPIALLTKKQVEAWRDALHPKYAPNSVNAAITCLSSAFAHFIDQQWLTVNPCHGVKRVTVPPRSYAWIRTRPEFERLMREARDELRDMMAVAVGTMMRLDEMLHLQWDDVDLENRLITIQRGRQGPPKNGKIRHVPILDSVLPVMQRRALKRDGQALVFPSPKAKRNGSRVRTQGPIGTSLKRALKAAKLDLAFRWHDLRHTGASWWVMSGGDIFRLSKIMGHSDVKITQKTYAHLAPEVWKQDYARLAFRVPEDGKVIAFTGDTQDTAATGARKSSR